MTEDFTEKRGRTRSRRDVALRFAPEEHAERLRVTRAGLRAQGVDALLVFAQESHYWLTGFDTAGYVENGADKVGHGSGGMIPLRAA